MAKKNGTPTKLEKIAAEIAECRDPVSGRITPDEVVKRARNKDSVLHDEFEWDVMKAAQQAWEERARELIRSVKDIVVYYERKIVVPYYVSDPTANEPSYVRTVQISNQGDVARRVMNDEIGRIKGAIKRAVALSIAFNLADDFEALLDDVVEVEKKFRGNTFGPKPAPPPPPPGAEEAPADETGA